MEPSDSRSEPLVLEPSPDPVTGALVYVVRPDAAASPSWEDIAGALRGAEKGGGPGSDVELRPGGRLVLSVSGRSEQPLSRLPRERMAAVNLGPLADDVDLLRLVDPGNVEGWRPVVTQLVAGWTFRLRPPVASQPDFVFFAFRSPSDGNAWRISALRPDLDREHGHRPHMINVSVGGQSIPVICGPAGRPARTLAEVRTAAAKWTAYTSRRLAGLPPGFSE